MNKLLIWLHDLGITAKYRGLKPLTKKRGKNDFDFGAFMLWGYSPKSNEKILKTVSVKDQRGLSNCSFQAATAAKEIDEGVVLSARDLTTSAYRKGLCRWEGWADLKAAQEVLKNIGIDEEKNVVENTNLSFGQYIGISQNAARQALHKTKSYWRINNVDEYLKAIDDDRPVVIGIDWFSGFNQGSGFSFPWLITRIIGSFVGGHALLGKGYNMNYQGRKVAVVQNSYSGLWGDKGDLYIDLDFLNTYIKKYGAYANLDSDYNKAITSSDIKANMYNGKNFKGDRGGAIYLIYEGKKVAYTSAEAFVAHNGFPYTAKGAFTVVPQAVIDNVEWLMGEESKSLIDGSMGKFSEIVENLRKPVNSCFKPDLEIKQ